MSDLSTIEALPRPRLGKGGARTLRREGRLPAVIYGGKGEPISVSIDAALLKREYHRRGFFTRLYDLSISDESVRVLPREVQTDPVSDLPIHVDFVRYVKGATLAIYVAVRFVGHEECDGLKRGGVLNVVRHEVELRCPLEVIPETIVANIAGLEIGDSVHISSIELPEGVTPTITDRDFTVATIASPTIHVEATEDEEGADEEGVEGEATETAEDAETTGDE